METFADVESGEVFGYRYTLDEIETALFAVRLYKALLERGQVIVGEEDVDTAIDLNVALDVAAEYLSEGSPEVEPRVHDFLVAVPLRLVTDLIRPMSVERYLSLCDSLGVPPAILYGHAIVASHMLGL